MRPSAAMWRLLLPWQNLSDGAIVSIWPCMPGFHRCSLGLHTSTFTLVKQPAATEAAECRHNYSGQLWFTALPVAIIFSILLVSIAAQDFTLDGTIPNAQLQLPVDQKVHIEIPLQSTVTSSWSIVFGKLGRLFDIRRFDPNLIKNNQNSSARPTKILLHESTSSKHVETEPSQEHLQPSAQRVPHSSSGFNTGLLSELIPPTQRHSNNQEGLYQKPSSTEQHLATLEYPKFRKLFSLPNKTCSNANQCSDTNCDQEMQGDICSQRIVHVAMTLDVNYLRGSMAAIYSILSHSECSRNIWFHFVATKGKEELEKIVAETLPFLQFQTYTFDESSVKSRISHAVRHALEEPLNYARFYLAHMIDPCVKKIIYLDSDVLVLDRIEELWMTDMGNSTVGTPEYCHANFPSYFTENFWMNSSLTSTFANKKPCYFNSGMMLINLERWRATECTATLEYWMEVQKEQHIYELGSLPPLLLTFAGGIQAIDHRWNQHGLGGDILKGDCRPSRNEPASLLHWSGGGKPWQRLDIQQPCPVDSIWAQYDLLDPTTRT